MKESPYNKIAQDYHLKRKYPWKPLVEFISFLKERNIEFNGVCLDLGCGNGRNFRIFKTENNKLIGLDNSLEFLLIAKQNLINSIQTPVMKLDLIQLILADINFIPFRTSSIKNIFSIASIHHIKGKYQRKKTISQLKEILSHDGILVLTLWRRWQKKFRKYFIIDWFKRVFHSKYKELQYSAGLNEFGDKIVPWTISSEKTVYRRFYHFFSKREIIKLIQEFEIKILKTLGGATNKDNFFIVAQKKLIK